MREHLFRSRRVRSVFAAGGAACVALAIASPAGAAIGNGHQITATATPNLVSAGVQYYQPNTGLHAEAKWCFNNSVNVPAGSQNDFFVAGYRGGQQESPHSVFKDPANSKCVIGEFGHDYYQLPASTVAGITDKGPAALTDSFGNPAFSDSVPFTGSYASGPVGRTNGPNILSFNVDTTNNVIQIQFDHILSPTVARGTIGFYDAGGAFHAASSTVVGGGGNNVVTAQFTTSSVANAYYLVVLAKAVAATDGTPANTGAGTPEEKNAAQSFPIKNLPTNAPALLSANVSGASSVDAIYDQPVSCGIAHDFSIVEVGDGDGNSTSGRGTAQATTCQGGAQGANSLRYTFSTGSTPPGAPVSEFISEFVRAIAGVGSAQSVDASHTTNILTTGAITGSPDAPGFTSAPDIVGAGDVPPVTLGEVTVNLDQPADFTGTALNAAYWKALAVNGTVVATASNVQLSANGMVITVDFPGNITGASGIVYDPPLHRGVSAAGADELQGFDAFNDVAVPQAVGFTATAMPARDAMARFNSQRLPAAVSVARYNANLKARAKALAKSKHHKKHKK